MNILKTSFKGTPNVGLFGYVTENNLLVGEHLSKKAETEVERVLEVPLEILKVAGTEMPGVFLAGNSNSLLVPNIASPRELKMLDKLGISYRIFETRHTCLGNNIACNDHGAIISSEFSEKERSLIEEYLGVPAVKMDIAGLKTPGAFIVLNNSKGIIHRDATEEEIKKVEEILQVKLSPATTNLGTPYLHASILNNKHGFIIGDASGGPEIVHIENALGYTE